MAAPGAGRGARGGRLPARRPKARDSPGPEGPSGSSDPKAPPGSPSPSRVLSPRTIDPKEDGREDAGFLEGAAARTSPRSSSVASGIYSLLIRLRLFSKKRAFIRHRVFLRQCLRESSQIIPRSHSLKDIDMLISLGSIQS